MRIIALAIVFLIIATVALLALADESRAQAVPDQRYGVISHSAPDAGPEHFLETLGVTWYHDYSSDVSAVPQSYEKLAYVTRLGPDNLMSPEEITSMVESRPAGSYWSIGSWPNVAGRSEASFYAMAYLHYHENIKAVDPDAKIAVPGILNWDHTCSPSGDCSYMPGILWMNEFLGEYLNLTGGKLPSVDVWTIGIYPLDLRNIPNNGPDQLVDYGGEPVLHSGVATGQIENFRAFLDANRYAEAPIWITDVAIQIGFDGWRRDQSRPGNPIMPSTFATFHWDFMSNYIHSILDWLELHADSKRIERWFFSVTWADFFTTNSGYMGITFFDGAEDGSALNCLGETYRARALGEPRVACDRDGNTVIESGPPSVPASGLLGMLALAAALVVVSASRYRWVRRSRPTPFT